MTSCRLLALSTRLVWNLAVQVNVVRTDNAMLPSRSLGAVMDIVVWLRSLGLGKYEAAFRDNEIDETVLPSLTHTFGVNCSRASA
jgi:hypothetical protein